MSHRHTELDFSEGITLLTGSSFSGKSAIMDAIFWVTNNSPQGESYVSYWTRNDKGKQTEDTYVALELDDHVITRYRGKNGNNYVLDGLTLDSIGTGVPEAIQKAINFTEVNSQNQMDPLFLVSSSGGDIARLLNRTVKLDLIDTFLSGIDSKKRKNKQELELQNVNKVSLEKELAKYTFLDKAEKLVDRIQKVEDGVKGLDTDIQAISLSLSLYQKSEDFLKSTEGIVERGLVCTYKIQKLSESDITQEISLLESRVRECRNLTQFLSTVEDMDKASKLVSKISKYLALVKEDDSDIHYIFSSVENFNVSRGIILSFEDDLSKLQALLPSVCPYCEQPIGVDKCLTI